MRKVFVLCCALLLPLGEAAAQPRAGGPGRPPRDEAFRMIDAYFISNLQESLSLSDEQFARLLPLVKRLQDDRRALATRRTKVLVELQRLLAGGDATESRVGEMLREIKVVEAEEPEVLRRDREAIDALLAPLQQAKYRVFEAEVERKIRNLMGQAARQRLSRRGGPQVPGPRDPE